MSPVGLALALALGAAGGLPSGQAVSGDGLAPAGPGHSAPGTKVDLVVRMPAAAAPGAPVPLRVLASDSATDAPLRGAQLDLRFFGPAGTSPIELKPVAGTLAGHYLATATFPKAGRWALAALADGEWLAANGFTVAAPAKEAGRGRAWPWILGAGLLLAGALAVRRALLPAGVALLCSLAAGEALAHGYLTPKAAAIPGADVYVPQEIQFALGLRTAPAAVETFPAPAGSGEAPRQFLGIPRSALVDREGKKLVFVRLAPERFVAREPKLGWERDGPDGPRVAVLSDLQLDERVVVDGAAFLRNGGATPPGGEAP